MNKKMLASMYALFFFCATFATAQNCAPKGHMFVQWSEIGAPAGTDVFAIYENILAGRATVGAITHANASAYTQAWGGQLPSGGSWTWTKSRGGELNYCVDDAGNAQQLCQALKVGIDIAIYSLPINGWYPVLKKGTNFCANAGRANWCPSPTVPTVTPKTTDPDCITCTPCLTVSTSAQTVQVGQQFTLSWNAACGTKSLCVDGTTIPLVNTSVRTANAAGQQCFTFVACCATGESITRQVCVTVIAPPPPAPTTCTACTPLVSCNAGWTGAGYNLETKNVSKIIFNGQEYSFNQMCGSANEIIFLPGSFQNTISFTAIDNCGNEKPYTNKVLTCPGCSQQQGRDVTGAPIRGNLRMISHDIRGGYEESTGYYSRSSSGSTVIRYPTNTYPTEGGVKGNNTITAYPTEGGTKSGTGWNPANPTEGGNRGNGGVITTGSWPTEGGNK